MREGGDMRRRTRLLLCLFAALVVCILPFQVFAEQPFDSGDGTWNANSGEVSKNTEIRNWIQHGGHERDPCRLADGSHDPDCAGFHDHESAGQDVRQALDDAVDADNDANVAGTTILSGGAAVDAGTGGGSLQAVVPSEQQGTVQADTGHGAERQADATHDAADNNPLVQGDADGYSGQSNSHTGAHEVGVATASTLNTSADADGQSDSAAAHLADGSAVAAAAGSKPAPRLSWDQAPPARASTSVGTDDTGIASSGEGTAAAGSAEDVGSDTRLPSQEQSLLLDRMADAAGKASGDGSGRLGGATLQTGNGHTGAVNAGAREGDVKRADPDADAADAGGVRAARAADSDESGTSSARAGGAGAERVAGAGTEHSDSGDDAAAQADAAAVYGAASQTDDAQSARVHASADTADAADAADDASLDAAGRGGQEGGAEDGSADPTSVAMLPQGDPHFDSDEVSQQASKRAGEDEMRQGSGAVTKSTSSASNEADLLLSQDAASADPGDGASALAADGNLIQSSGTTGGAHTVGSRQHSAGGDSGSNSSTGGGDEVVGQQDDAGLSGDASVIRAQGADSTDAAGTADGSTDSGTAAGTADGSADGGADDRADGGDAAAEGDARGGSSSMAERADDGADADAAAALVDEHILQADQDETGEAADGTEDWGVRSDPGARGHSGSGDGSDVVGADEGAPDRMDTSTGAVEAAQEARLVRPSSATVADARADGSAKSMSLAADADKAADADADADADSGGSSDMQDGGAAARRDAADLDTIGGADLGDATDGGDKLTHDDNGGLLGGAEIGAGGADANSDDVDAGGADGAGGANGDVGGTNANSDGVDAVDGDTVNGDGDAGAGGSKGDVASVDAGAGGADAGSDDVDAGTGGTDNGGSGGANGGFGGTNDATSDASSDRAGANDIVDDDNDLGASDFEIDDDDDNDDDKDSNVDQARVADGGDAGASGANVRAADEESDAASGDRAATDSERATRHYGGRRYGGRHRSRWEDTPPMRSADGDASGAAHDRTAARDGDAAAQGGDDKAHRVEVDDAVRAVGAEAQTGPFHSELEAEWVHGRPAAPGAARHTGTAAGNVRQRQQAKGDWDDVSAPVVAQPTQEHMSIEEPAAHAVKEAPAPSGNAGGSGVPSLLFGLLFVLCAAAGVAYFTLWNHQRPPFWKDLTQFAQEVKGMAAEVAPLVPGNAPVDKPLVHRQAAVNSVRTGPQAADWGDVGDDWDSDSEKGH